MDKSFEGAFYAVLVPRIVRGFVKTILRCFLCPGWLLF
jgi:hypothetical protein